MDSYAKDVLIFTNLEKWCEFLHRPGKIYTDFSEVGKEIRLRQRDIDIKNKLAKEKISYVFDETFAEGLASIDPLEEMTDDQILNVILASKDLESSLFHPEVR